MTTTSTSVHVPSSTTNSSTIHFASVSPHVPVTTPLISNRPSRSFQLPSKFTDYTSIPAHLCNHIQLHTTIHTPGSLLHVYVAELPVDISSMFFVSIATQVNEPTTYKQAV